MIGLVLGPVVQKVDKAIQRINHYPANNTIGVCNTCPLDSDLSGGQCYPTFEQPGPEENGNVLVPVVQKSDSAIHRINRYPADKYYENQLRYPLDSNLSSGYRYPPFEQLGPDSSDSDSVALTTPLTTPNFDFHKVISALTTALTIPTPTPSQVKTLGFKSFANFMAYKNKD